MKMPWSRCRRASGSCFAVVIAVVLKFYPSLSAVAVAPRVLSEPGGPNNISRQAAESNIKSLISALTPTRSRAFSHGSAN